MNATRAIEFALNLPDADGMRFLRMWRADDWVQIRSCWPELSSRKVETEGFKVFWEDEKFWLEGIYMEDFSITVDDDSRPTSEIEVGAIPNQSRIEIVSGYIVVPVDLPSDHPLRGRGDAVDLILAFNLWQEKVKARAGG